MDFCHVEPAAVFWSVVWLGSLGNTPRLTQLKGPVEHGWRVHVGIIPDRARRITPCPNYSGLAVIRLIRQ